jgi:S1-C subfamily serine protease
MTHDVEIACVRIPLEQDLLEPLVWENSDFLCQTPITLPPELPYERLRRQSRFPMKHLGSGGDPQIISRNSSLRRAVKGRTQFTFVLAKDITMRPLAFITTLCFQFVAQSLLGQDFSEALSVIEPSTVLIRTLDSEDKPGLGTGFFVDGKGLLITNAHVIDGAPSAVVQLSDGAGTSIISIKAIYPDADIAFVNTGLKSSRAVKFAPESEIKKEAAVAVLGNPKGLEFSLSTGIVAGLRKANSMEYVQFTANTRATGVK